MQVYDFLHRNVKLYIPMFPTFQAAMTLTLKNIFLPTDLQQQHLFRQQTIAEATTKFISLCIET